jgi:membrane protein
LPAGDALLQAYEQAKEHDVPGLAAELSFRAALSVLPFLLVIAALPSVAGDLFSVENVGERLSREADALFSENSAEAVRTLIGEVERSHGWTPLIFGLLGTLWAGTMTTSTLRKALDRVYGFVDGSSLLRRKLKDLGLTVVAGLLFFLSIMAVMLGPAILGGETVLTEMLSVGIALLAVLAAVSLLYWLAPSGDNMFRWVTPGALVFGAGWLIFSLGFSAYLSRFGLINHVYGSLGAMIILLIWLYGSNFFLLLGAELNSVLAQERDPNVPANGSL